MRNNTCGTPAASTRRKWSIKECLLAGHTTRRVQIQIRICLKSKRCFDVFCIQMRSFSTGVLNSEQRRTFRCRFQKKVPFTFQRNVNPSVCFQPSTSVASKATMNEARESAQGAPPPMPIGKMQLLVSTVSTNSHSTAGCLTPCCCWLLLSSTHRQIADFLIACTCT